MTQRRRNGTWGVSHGRRLERDIDVGVFGVGATLRQALAEYVDARRFADSPHPPPPRWTRRIDLCPECRLPPRRPMRPDLDDALVRDFPLEKRVATPRP